MTITSGNFLGRVKLNSSYIRYSPELSFALEEKLVLSCIFYGLLKENIKKKNKSKQLKTFPVRLSKNQ